MEPARAEDARELVRDAEAVDHLFGLRLPRRLGSEAERAGDAAVGELRRALHVAADEPRALDRAARVELGVHAEAEPRHVREERAEVRRQRAREHRDRAVGEVDAAAAAPGLLVDLRLRSDVRADVGDRDPDLVAAALGTLDPHRVVVIARVLGIDRRQRDVREILAAAEHLLRDLGAVRLGLGDGLGGVDLLDLREEEDLFDLDRELARLPEHRDDLALGVLAGLVGEARDLGDDDLAFLAAVAFGAGAVDLAREDDGPADARIVELDPGVLSLPPEDAGDARRPALHDLDDLAFGAARAARDDLDDDVVAVHRAAQRVGVDEDVVAARGRARDEAEAARVHREEALAPLAAPALRAEALLLLELEPLALRGDDAVEDEVVQEAEQALVRRLADAELLGELVRMDRTVFGAEGVEDSRA